MKIGELARGSGPKASAIRYYKKRGLILPPHRMGGSGGTQRKRWTGCC